MTDPARGQRRFTNPGQVQILNSHMKTSFQSIANCIISESGFKGWLVIPKKSARKFSRFNT